MNFEGLKLKLYIFFVFPSSPLHLYDIYIYAVQYLKTQHVFLCLKAVFFRLLVPVHNGSKANGGIGMVSMIYSQKIKKEQHFSLNFSSFFRPESGHGLVFSSSEVYMYIYIYTENCYSN